MRILIILALCVGVGGCDKSNYLTEREAQFIITPEMQFEEDVLEELYKYKVQEEALNRIHKEN